MMTNPRILVGTGELAKYTSSITLGLKELGYEADSLVLPNRIHPFYKKTDYTFMDAEFLDGTTCMKDDNGGVTVQYGPKFFDFVDKYDIFIFVGGTSFLPRMVDVPMLKERGKTIICRQCGTEVRDAEMAKIFWSAHGRRYPYYKRDIETPKVRCSNHRDILSLGRYHPALANKLHNTRMAERYADAIVCAPPSQTVGIRPYFQSGPIINNREFVCNIPKRRTPIILHSPSSTLYKQTDRIIDALAQLKAEGLNFHLELLQDVPHEVVRAKLTEADILIDQISCGSGVLGYEGMASGCAVLSSYNGVESPMPRNRPVLNISFETLKDRIRQVVEDMDLRCGLAERGRDYIDMGIGSPASVGEYMMESLNRTGRYDADIYPTLYSMRAFIPEGETVPDYLNEQTLEIMQVHGVSPQADLQRLVREGLLPDDPTRLATVPRWDMGRLREEGSWVITGQKATYGMPDQTPDQISRHEFTKAKSSSVSESF